MTVGTLFSGIGGWDLAACRVWGWGCLQWQVEIDPFCARVLAKHWPEVKRYGDIKEVEAGELVPVDVILASPPCQSISVAGKRLGDADPRWLWGEVFRICAVVRPRWLVCENPPGLLGLGYDTVVASLEALSYEVGTVGIPASALGANHQRERLWIIAHANGDRRGIGSGEQQRDARVGEGEVPDDPGFVGERGRHPRKWRSGSPDRSGESVSHAGSEGLSQRDGSEPARPHAADSGGAGWTVEPGVVRVVHGISTWLDEVGRMTWPTGWDVSVPALCGRQKDRRKRVKALGNAIVPQCAELILRVVDEVERMPERDIFGG